MDEKVKAAYTVVDTTAFYAKVEKYGGWNIVPAERVYSVFDDVLGLQKVGFILAKRGWWARRIDDDIVQIVKVDALKGRAYGICYGLSLSFVPYPYVPKLKWHRSLKSLWPDLSERPQVHLHDSFPLAGEAELCVVNTMLGERCLRDELELGWKTCSLRIFEWFDSTRDFHGIVERCNQHLARPVNEIQYVPGAQLVRIFTYAKLGRSEAARQELDLYLDVHKEGAEAHRNLHSALDQVIGRERTT